MVNKIKEAHTFLNRLVQIKVDRPLGSRHPMYGFHYPVNYGHVLDTPTPDSDNLDAYVPGNFEPLEAFMGRCLAIDHRQDDEDDKLIIVPEDRHYSEEQIQALVEFQERFFTSVVQR